MRTQTARIKSRKPSLPEGGGRQTATTMRWSLASVACGLVALLALGMVAVLPPTVQASATKYGASDAAMWTAVNAAAWPEQTPVWCGVATVAAIARFRGHAVSQADAARFLNSSTAISEWGVPSYSYPGPGVQADISRDSGTDPRSLAEGLAVEAGGVYHQFVDQRGAWDATYHLAVDVELARQPVSAIVFRGQHSVLVSAVFATADPLTNPSSITALEVWDPGYGANAQIQWAQMVVVPLYTWLYDDNYWGSAYDSRWDPDPAVGPYTYDPSRGDNVHLWTGRYVYIQPGGVAGINADWALNQDGAVIPGTHGELPTGYLPPARTPATPSPVDTPAAVPAPASAVIPAAPAGQGPAQGWCLGPLCLDIAPVGVADISRWSPGRAAGGTLLLVTLGGWGAAAWRRRRTGRKATMVSVPLENGLAASR